MKRFVEIRLYNLKPGTCAEFHALITNQSRPMLERWNVDVVANGPSLHQEDSYYLIRAYANLEDRQQSQDHFYSSEEWHQGPRTAIISLINSYNLAVIEMDEATIAALRN